MKISYFRLDIESVYSSHSGDSNKGIFKQIHQEMVELNWLQRYDQNLVVFVPKIETNIEKKPAVIAAEETEIISFRTGPQLSNAGRLYITPSLGGGTGGHNSLCCGPRGSKGRVQLE